MILLFLAAAGWRRRTLAGTREFSLLCLSLALYLAGNSLELTGERLELLLLAGRLEYVGISYLPVCWILFCFTWCGYRHLLDRKAIALLFSLSTVTLLLYQTTSYHGLVYSSVALDSSGPFPTLIFNRGIWYWVHMAYLNAAFLAANILFVRQFRSAMPIHRRQAATMMLASFIPWLTLAVYLTRVGPHNIDLNPFALSLTGFLSAWGIFRQRLFGFGPMARYELVEGMRDPVLVFDGSGRLLDHNRCARHLFGVPERHDVGTTAEDISRYNPGLGDALFHAAQGEEVTYRRDGRIFSLSMTELRPDSEQTLKLCLFHDMTGQAKAEESLRTLNATLEERVAREVGENLKKEQLLARQTRFAAMGEMIAAIAHQWRQPLTTVSAHIQNIKAASDRGRLDAAFVEKTVAAARQQCEHMSATIEEFRVFFRPDKERELFDVRQKLEEIARLFHHQATALGITLAIDGGTGRPVRINGYPGEFKQVILNLLSNAGDAIRERRSTCQGDFEGRVVITLEEREGEVVVEVLDNGCGIPEFLRERIFDPYFTTKGEGEGTGIGLYYCKMIVETSMGGRLPVSDRNGWTCFTLYLTGATR